MWNLVVSILTFFCHSCSPSIFQDMMRGRHVYRWYALEQIFLALFQTFSSPLKSTVPPLQFCDLGCNGQPQGGRQTGCNLLAVFQCKPFQGFRWHHASWKKTFISKAWRPIFHKWCFQKKWFVANNRSISGRVFEHVGGVGRALFLALLACAYTTISL